MELDFSNETKEALDAYYDEYLKIFNNTILELKKPNNYICSVTFVEKDKIHEINRDYRNIDRPTDVISFAYLDDKNRLQINR